MFLGCTGNNWSLQMGYGEMKKGTTHLQMLSESGVTHTASFHAQGSNSCQPHNGRGVWCEQLNLVLAETLSVY